MIALVLSMKLCLQPFKCFFRKSVSSEPTSWYPKDQVLKSLIFNNSIPRNKQLSSILCRACQFGKHIQLPFTLSNCNICNAFDIIQYHI